MNLNQSRHSINWNQSYGTTNGMSKLLDIYQPCTMRKKSNILWLFQDYDVSYHREIHLKFTYDSELGKSLSVLTKVYDQDVNASLPLRINVRLDQGSTSWEIPYALSSKSANSINGYDELNYEIERSLCLLKDGKDQNGTIVVSTSIRKNITFQVQIKQKPNNITMNEMKLGQFHIRCKILIYR